MPRKRVNKLARGEQCSGGLGCLAEKRKQLRRCWRGFYISDMQLPLRAVIRVVHESAPPYELGTCAPIELIETKPPCTGRAHVAIAGESISAVSVGT
jgi:hypothetical protein